MPVQTLLSLVFLTLIDDMSNSLPFSIRSLSSISSFKRGLRNFLMNTNLTGRITKNSYAYILEFLYQILINCINYIFKLYISLGGLSEDGVLDSFTDHPYGISFVIGR